jgi:protein-S-isoprenylcysteine O-methyltransferase Ste14
MGHAAAGPLVAGGTGPGCAILSEVKRMSRAAGVVVWTFGAVAMHVVVPFELSRLGDRAGRPGRRRPAVVGAGLLTVAAGGTLMAWAFAAHYQQAPRGWPLGSGLTPGYLLRRGPYRLSRNPMCAGEAVAWAGWGPVYGSPAVWAGLAIMCTGLATTVRWEERRLLQRFGEDYRVYLAEVSPLDATQSQAREGSRSQASAPSRTAVQLTGYIKSAPDLQMCFPVCLR